MIPRNTLNLSFLILFLLTVCFCFVLPSIQKIVISPKKGFAATNNKPMKGTFYDLATSLNVAWCYNWGVKPPAIYGYNQTIDFTPMLWSAKYVTNETIANLTVINHDHGGTLLGFNEPNKAEQSNMTVEQAIALWPQLVKTNRRLGSPAMAGNPVGKSTWLYKFMSLANSSKLTVDFITIHWYSTPNLASSFLKEIDDAYKMYNRPIWITEFACADWDATASNPTSYTPQDVIPFMKTVIPGLLNRTYVERFSWFSPINPSDVNLGFSALFYVNGSLTELGKLYASFGVSYSTDEDSSSNDTVIALSSSLNIAVASSSINRQFSTGYPNRATSDAFIVQGLESLLLMIILILASLIL